MSLRSRSAVHWARNRRNCCPPPCMSEAMLRTYIEHPQDLDVAALQIRCPLGTQSQELLSTAMHV